MPFQSEAQRKYLYANHPQIAKRWTQEAKNQGRQDAIQRRLAKERNEAKRNK